MLGKFLKRMACKMTICCKSKCSLEPQEQQFHSQLVKQQIEK